MAAASASRPRSARSHQVCGAAAARLARRPDPAPRRGGGAAAAREAATAARPRRYRARLGSSRSQRCPGLGRSRITPFPPPALPPPGQARSCNWLRYLCSGFGFVFIFILFFFFPFTHRNSKKHNLRLLLTIRSEQGRPSASTTKHNKSGRAAARDRGREEGKEGGEAVGNGQLRCAGSSGAPGLCPGLRRRRSRRRNRGAADIGGEGEPAASGCPGAEETRERPRCAPAGSPHPLIRHPAAGETTPSVPAPSPRGLARNRVGNGSRASPAPSPPRCAGERPGTARLGECGVDTLAAT
ncbi:translation initiation factor IF-2-like [Manacus candei]|uniref:translation initiation factor IF-2-like n=1 Tax=Manacus candei TaxID=415023 RepID=UPI002227DCDD|nr:translation initiation factor IF-2-like [Manacus candei]XP_051655000.1 translation initiation factor IF-2-like [Manacus candei]XP_051655001.1 translation initiation factor IF-2-like [Manacus candei]